MAVHTCQAIRCYSTIGPNLLMCRYHWAMVPYLQQQQLSNTTLTSKEFTKLFATIKLELWDRATKAY